MEICQTQYTAREKCPIWLAFYDGIVVISALFRDEACDSP